MARIRIELNQEITEAYHRCIGEYDYGIVKSEYFPTKKKLFITFKSASLMFSWATEFGMWYINEK